MVATDVIWGTVLTAVSAWGGVALTKTDLQRLTMILYGISTCDTCKKALKALESAGRDVTFRDIRAQAVVRG